MKLRQYVEGRPPRKSLNRNRRLAMWKQSHGRCWYCGNKVPKGWFVLDHVVPFSKAGADSARNLVVSCAPCDREKRNLTLEEFRAVRGGVLFYGELRTLKIEPFVKFPSPSQNKVDVRPCKHIGHDTLVEACYRRDEIQRVTGTHAWFAMCPRCTKWRVRLSHKPSKQALRLLVELAEQEKLPVTEYLP